MKSVGIFSDVHTEIGQIIVAQVSKERVAELLKPDRVLLLEMIRKTAPALQGQTIKIANR
jgi:isocitrate lyase